MNEWNALEFSSSDESLSEHDCSSPVRFWFCCIILKLQWVLLLVVMVWYKMETMVMDKIYLTEDDDDDELSSEKDDQHSFYSFPNPH